MNPDHVFAIVLAAGSASRFGDTKQLAPVDGEALVSRAVRLASTVLNDRVVLVIGNDRQRVASACAPFGGFITVNTDYRSGISTSIRAGIGAVAPVADAALLLLADQPLVGMDHLQTMIATWRRRPAAIIASAYAGTAGPPVIFPFKLRQELISVIRNRGARQVIDRHMDIARFVELENAAHDLDRPEDLEELLKPGSLYPSS